MDEFAPLLTWFASSGGSIAQKEDGSGPVWALEDLSSEGMGTGVVATTDLPAQALLFSLPRSLVLSTRTSQLPRLLLAHEKAHPIPDVPKWDDMKRSWTGLMVCMLWERARSLSSQWALGQTDEDGALGQRGKQQQWGEYLQSMPQEFDTPMFWTPEELAWLQGTSIQSTFFHALLL